MRRLLIALFISLLSFALALLVAWLIDQQASTALPLVQSAIIAFAINWIAFVPASLLRTEKFYDLVGAITYLSLMVFALLTITDAGIRSLVVAALVVIWSTRLGLFLFLRIKKDGKDVRFDEIKQTPSRFLLAWSIQALWVFLTAVCALFIIHTNVDSTIDGFFVLGLLLWLLGFSLEVIADWQKARFRAVPKNSGTFITIGLWSWSRHPNYFGEILLWFGIAVIGLPLMQGWQYLALISPLFVFLLIRYVSGINRLQAIAEQRWGQDQDYKSYCLKTNLLLPWPPK